MRSVAITLSGIVAAPIDRVFDLLTDPHRAPDWLPGCQSVRVNGSPGRKGERWHLRVRTPLRLADLQIEILEYTPPTGFAWHEIVPPSRPSSSFTTGSGRYLSSLASLAKHSASAAEPIAIRRWRRNSLDVPSAYPSTMLASTDTAARRNCSNKLLVRG